MAVTHPLVHDKLKAHDFFGAQAAVVFDMIQRFYPAHGNKNGTGAKFIKVVIYGRCSNGTHIGKK